MQDFKLEIRSKRQSIPGRGWKSTLVSRGQRSDGNYKLQMVCNDIWYIRYIWYILPILYMWYSLHGIGPGAFSEVCCSSRSARVFDGLCVLISLVRCCCPKSTCCVCVVGLQSKLPSRYARVQRKHTVATRRIRLCRLLFSHDGSQHWNQSLTHAHKEC